MPAFGPAPKAGGFARLVTVPGSQNNRIWRDRLSRALDVIAAMELVVCCVSVILIFLAVIAQVFARFVFNSPLSWVNDVATIAFVSAVYFGCSLAVTEGGHIRVKIVVDLLPKKLNALWEILVRIVWIAILFFLLFLSFQYYDLLSRSPIAFQGVGIRYAHVFPAVIVGFGLTAAKLLISLFFEIESAHERSS